MSRLRTCLGLVLSALTACGPGMVPATVPSTQPVCLRLTYHRPKRLPDQPKELRLSPGVQHGYVDWPVNAPPAHVGEWTHDGGSWLWMVLPTGSTSLRYVLVTTGSTVRGQVTSDASSRAELPGVADVTGRLRACR